MAGFYLMILSATINFSIHMVNQMAFDFILILPATAAGDRAPAKKASLR
jgi:hypothetical protein